VLVYTYKFRLYPTPQQILLLEGNLETCRRLYNQILSSISKGNKLSKVDTQNFIPEWKKTNPYLKKVYSKVLQMVNYTLWSNVRGLSESKKKSNRIGGLRFKGKGWYKTLNFNQSGFKIDESNNRIKFSKIGNIRTIIHRKIDGAVKGIIIKKTNTGKWFVNVQIDKQVAPLPVTGKDVGLDVGISKFVTDSDKNEFEYPRNIDKTLTKIKKQQRELSGKKKGSNNRKKVKQQLGIIYETLENQRIDFLHKMSTYYIRNYDLIAHEDLNITNMLQSKRSKTLNRHILDASWGEFFNMLNIKAESAGRKVVKVDPKNTTPKCSVCKTIVPKKLSDRTHNCNCGHLVPRDYNAAQNVLFDAYSLNGNRRKGLSSLFVEKNPLLFTFSSNEIASGKIFC